VTGQEAVSARDYGVFEFFFIAIVFICILALAYFFTRFIAGRASGRMKSRYMQIVDVLAFGTGAQFLLLKIGGGLYLAAKSQKQVTQLIKLDLKPEDLPSESNGTPGFAENFKHVLEGKIGLAGLHRRKEEKPPS
jgi:flagellar biogenesis protein FliO